MCSSRQGRREHQLIGVGPTSNNRLQQSSPNINTSAPKTDRIVCGTLLKLNGIKWL